MNTIDEELLEALEFGIDLPYDEFTEQYIPWHKFRMETIKKDIEQEDGENKWMIKNVKRAGM